MLVFGELFHCAPQLTVLVRRLCFLPLVLGFASPAFEIRIVVGKSRFQSPDI